MFKYIMSRSYINNIITKFESKCTGPLQLSKEWFAIREKGSRKRGRIGGSDIATLLELNQYKTKKQLMREKQGIKRRKVFNSFPMVFGSVFEEVAVCCFEKTFNTKVYCKNISIVDPKGYDYMIYSPDGLCALPIDDGQLFIDYDDESYSKMKKFVPVLVEIKCPTRRELTRDGDVPIQYYPQLQAGMLSIDIAHSAIFIDNQIRVCSYQDLYEGSSINKKIHDKCSVIEEDSIPINIGAFLIYGELPEKINKKYIRKEFIGGKKIYDYGNCYNSTFTHILTAVRDNLVRVEFLPPCDNIDELDIVDKIRSSKEEHIGIVCWKVFDVTYTTVNKNINFIQKIVKELDKYHSGELDLDEEPEPEEVVMERRDTTMPVEPPPRLSFDSDDSDNESSHSKRNV